MNKILIIPIALCCFIRFTFPCSAQDRKNFETISDQTASLLLESVFQNRALDLPKPEQKLPSEVKLYDIWRGNIPLMSPEVKGMTLNFELEHNNSLSKPDEKIADNSFSLIFDFQKDNIVLRHSRSLDPKQAGGFRLFDPNKNKNRSFFYRGQGGSGIVILVPQLAKKDSDRGVLICPRDFKKFEKSAKIPQQEKKSLVPTDYVVQSVKADVQGKVSTKIENILNFVMAKAKLISSPGLPLSEVDSDESYARIAQVDLEYRPDASRDFPQIQNYSNFVIGLMAFSTQQFSTGYKRNSSKSNLIYVKRVNVDHDFKAPMKIADTAGTMLYEELKNLKFDMEGQGVIDINVMSGPCYLVLNEVQPIIYEYLKEPFELPEKYKIKE